MAIDNNVNIDFDADTIKYIDYETIIKSCKLLMEAAQKLSDTSKKIVDAQYYCSREFLQLGGKNIEDDVELYAKSFNDVSNYISDFSEDVLTALKKVIEKKTYLTNDGISNSNSNLEEKGNINNE